MWKGPFKEIKEACERFGIDTEAGPKPVTLMPKEEQKPEPEKPKKRRGRPRKVEVEA